MPLHIDPDLTPAMLRPAIERLFEISAGKIRSIEKSWRPRDGTPVFTRHGRYTTRGWTEWTQGFQFGSAILQFEATGEREFLELGRRRTAERMAPHLSHVGVHDHGFNNVSTYGNLRRLLAEGLAVDEHPHERKFHELALKVSGAVQASRWTRLADGTGFIHSFNGPHSLFVDTIRSLRVLALAHDLGHVLMGEQDEKISLLARLLDHARNTARYNLYYGEGRDAYDQRGRTAHEAVFNVTSGVYRCPNSQQGFSPFTTWTRGLAWALLGFSEQLEWILSRESSLRVPNALVKEFLRAGVAAADLYLENSCADGIPMWDTGAPQLHRLGDYLDHPSDPFNRWEPVDSSAACIAAQGFLRLATVLTRRRDRRLATHYRQAGLTIARTLFSEPYLSLDPRHQGLILHSVYHRPNGWDVVHRGQAVPNGESSMWGDYHARELALQILRRARGEPELTFFGPVPRGG